MAGQESDVHALKQVRSVLSRRGIDASRADVRVKGGVCYIRGIVKAIPSAHISDIETEMQQVAHIIRQKPGITNVVLEISSR